MLTVDDMTLTPNISIACRETSPRRIAANRRNALKSTGPRTAAGKRRAALNRLRFKLCPAELERQLRARGEDPREFRELHRDLIALFQPADVAGVRVVELLAETWWEKARRIRQWVAAGQPRCYSLDARLEELLMLAINIQRQRHERWRIRLAEVLGWPVGSPAEARRRIELRLRLFGARRASRKYPRQHSGPYSGDEIEAAVQRILAGPGAPGDKSSANPGQAPPSPDGGNEANRSQGS